MDSMPSIVRSYIQLDPAGDVWKGLCPFHKDKNTKSFVVYPDHAYCFGCGRAFYPISFLMGYLHISRQEALEKLGHPRVILPSFRKPKRRPDEEIPFDIIKTWHGMLGSHRSYFYNRLFVDETIDTQLWGWDGKRYVIPVWEGEPGKRCISVRRRASKEGVAKYLGLKNYNPRVLYRLWELKYYYRSWPTGVSKAAFIFFGEFDAALAGQDGLPTISPTNGQNSWLDKWDEELRGFEIVVVPDKGEEFRGFQIASRFPGKSSVVQWPEGDFNDYNSFRCAGGTPDDFLRIVSAAATPEYAVERFWDADLAS